MAKVSIIIPIYNMEEKLERCLGCLLAQTYRNIEIILIDDKSTDGTLNVCYKFAQQDSRIIVISNETNQGAGFSRNSGILKASGEFYYFPDADDELDYKAIEIMVSKMETSKSDLLVFGYIIRQESGCIVKSKRYINIEQSGEDIRSNYYVYANMRFNLSIQGAAWNKCFKSNIVKEFGIKFPSLKRHEDEVFIARYVSHAEKICFIDDMLYTYYVNNLKSPYCKYPKNYLDNVHELYEERKRTLNTWNPTNFETINWVNIEYICNVVKAMELVIFRREVTALKDVLNNLNEIISESNLSGIHVVDNYQFNRLCYQKAIFKLSIRKRNFLVYILLTLKIKYQILLSYIVNRLSGN